MNLLFMTNDIETETKENYLWEAGDQQKTRVLQTENIRGAIHKKLVHTSGFPCQSELEKGKRQG